MSEIAEFLIAVGGLLLLGLATDFLGKRTFLPRVTLLLIFGIIAGDDVLAVIPDSIHERFELITNMALLMVGFLLGGKLTVDTLRQEGRQLMWISLSAALGVVLIVTITLIWFGIPTPIALLLGCIASATAPAGTMATVLEAKSESPFSKLLLAIVAIDDAWALILFSFGLAVTSILNGGDNGSLYLLEASYDIGGALLLGVAIGLPAAYLTGRLNPGEPMLTEALGLVFICGGLALWLKVSFLIAAMTMGAMIANLAKHHEYPFHEIENVEWPFMVMFFLLAGASLELSSLVDIGLIGGLYLLARAIGKLAGAWFGATVSKSDNKTRRWMGFALLPQAGVAIGMALLAAHEYPQYQQIILSIVIGTTVIFEVIGPICTRIALRRTE